MAERSDDPGVLGNLPRSRPGTRSSKRATGAGAPAKKPSAARSSATARKSPGAAKPRKPATTPRARTSTPPPRRQQPQPADPVTQAVRLAGKVAETGVKTAVGILKRLPGGR